MFSLLLHGEISKSLTVLCEFDIKRYGFNVLHQRGKEKCVLFCLVERDGGRGKCVDSVNYLN